MIRNVKRALLLLLLALASLLTPDYAVPSEVWELQGSAWEVRVCAIPVYFVGPLAVENRGDCGQGWTVEVR